MAKSFVLHDESVNTYGFRMLTDGANLEEFKKNPVMLFIHNDYSMPIGRWENIRKEGGKILADPVFDMKDKDAAIVARKVADDFIRMASIGAWPPEETTDDPALKLPGQTMPTVTKWTVREASIVVIGGNHNALAFYDRKSNQVIELSDKEQLITLFDKTDLLTNKKRPMSELNRILKLSDSASESAVTEEVRKIIELRDNLALENSTLKTEKGNLETKLRNYEQKQKEQQKTDAITLVDDAIKAGLINASGRESWLKDFDANFDQAKIRLSSIPARQSVSEQLNTGKANGTVNLSDMSFKEILEKDQLRELKSDPELYRRKFYEEYGKYPS